MYHKMAYVAVAGPWGWASYFTELARLIQTSEEHRGCHTTQQYAEYKIKHLGVCC